MRRPIAVEPFPAYVSAETVTELAKFLLGDFPKKISTDLAAGNVSNVAALLQTTAFRSGVVRNDSIGEKINGRRCLIFQQANRALSPGRLLQGFREESRADDRVGFRLGGAFIRQDIKPRHHPFPY